MVTPTRSPRINPNVMSAVMSKQRPRSAPGAMSAMAANMPVAGAGMPPSMPAPPPGMPGMKEGGNVKKMASGGSASSRADGIASRGKTVGKVC